MKLKILDLFSGLGGFSLGLERTGNFETVAFCEIDKYCTLLLQKHWKGTKIYNDVKEITKERLKADGVQLPDIITGGFPCQPFSVAGKQKGTSDDRHLWPEMFRIIKEFTPRWVVGENVKGITNIQDGMVFETVCTDLEGEGYEVRTFNIPAAGVGAPHRRERMWIVANRKESMVNPDDVRLEQHNTAEEEAPRRRTSTTFEPTGSADMENSRRTLQQGTELREKNEDETGKEDANQHQRSGSPSESDVADTQGERTRENDEGLRSGTSRISGRKETTVANTDEGRSHGQKHKIQTGRNIPVSSSEDVANTGFQGLERTINEKLSTTERSTDVANTESSLGNVNEAVTGNGEPTTQEVSGDRSSVRGESAWWNFEPDVGRVAHGVPGRVYRLKALGNSIVPQIAQEIGQAIIKAEREEWKTTELK
jgi:DNA (cytosine-5)-methyltransferase 1